jgi:hypothetical protein
MTLPYAEGRVPETVRLLAVATRRATAEVNLRPETDEEGRLMKRYLQLTLAAALLITVHEAPAAGQAESSSQATPVAPCDMRLRVELTPDIANPRDAGVISSLVTSHPDYQLSLEHSDLENSSIIALSLRGPGPEAGCRDVVQSMRRNARVVSVEVQADATGTGLAMRTEQPLGSVRPPSALQRKGTVRAGPDGDLILEPLNGVSYAQQARDRYECDIGAVDQTGFDPTEYDGGVPPDALPGKRADYLRAEAACLQNRGYVVE